MRIKLSNLLVTALLVTASLTGYSWGQTVPLAEKRDIIVNGVTKTIVSKLSKLNPNKTRVRSVMDLSFTYGYDHVVGKKLMSDMLDRFATQEGWTVSHYYYADPNHNGVDDRSKVNKAELNKNLVVFANQISGWAQGGNDNSGITTDLESYLNVTGGGVMVMHGSGDSKEGGGWKFYYNKLHPCLFDGHGDKRDGPVFKAPSAMSHPIMEGVLDTAIILSGEWHRFNKLVTDANPKAEILIKMDWTKCLDCYPDPAWRFAGGNPISWAMPVGAGWVGYFEEGHDNSTYDQMTHTMYEKLFKQMFFYIAGYDTLGTTIGVLPKPDYARDRSGISFNNSEASVFIEQPGFHSVQIMDVAGHQIFAAKGKNRAEYNYAKELQHAKPGVYIIKVTTAKVTRSKKFTL